MAWTQLNSDTSFEQVREQIEEDDAGKWDTLAWREQLLLRDGALTFPLDNDGEHLEQLIPTPWATGQLCQRLGIPTAYFRRCPTVLQDIQANHWLKNPSQGPDKSQTQEPVESEDFSASSAPKRTKAPQPANDRWLLRARYGTLRGILSERYSRLDNADLIANVRQAVGEGPFVRFQIGWFGLDDESLHLRLVDPSASRDALPQDRLMAGIHIANSEIGKRAVTVDAMVFRRVCSNGLIRLVKGKSLLYQRHIHVGEEKFAAALSAAIQQALSAATEFMEQLVQTTRVPVKDMDTMLDFLGERWSLSQTTQSHIRQALLQERPEQQETVWGLVNAVTNAAQSLPSDDRYDLEVLAGNLATSGMHRELALARRHVRSERQLPQGHAVNGGMSHNGSSSHSGNSLQNRGFGARAMRSATPSAAAPTQAASPTTPAPSIVEMAQDMFEAELIGRSGDAAETTEGSEVTRPQRAPVEVKV